MTCAESPDTGTAAGVYNRTWNNLNIYRTNISYHCPVGQAFDTIYNNTVNSSCTYHSQDDTEISWKYHAGNPLPACIRKIKNI